MAINARMKVARLELEDFNYITYMDNFNNYKSNLLYYKEVLKKINAMPENCIMVGNGAVEDMIVEKLRTLTYLIIG